MPRVPLMDAWALRWCEEEDLQNVDLQPMSQIKGITAGVEVWNRGIPKRCVLLKGMTPSVATLCASPADLTMAIDSTTLSLEQWPRSTRPVARR